MKAAVAVASLVGLVGRCSGLDLPGGVSDIPEHWPHHDPGHEPSDDRCDPPPLAATGDAGTPDYDCGPPGLYKDHSFKQLADGVFPYTPRYQLWADGADKQRFIYLPDDTQIDTNTPERWKFPVGTRIYKTFSSHGVKLETRMFQKTAEPADFGSWKVEAYVWSEDQRSIHPADPNGEGNVLGKDHDVPSQAECKLCHAQAERDIVNGFEAIQLNHDGPGWTLQRLLEQGRLVNSEGAPNVSVENSRIPGDDVAQDALGYLHANCAHCHRGARPGPKVQFDFRLKPGLTKVSDAAAYQVAASCTKLVGWIGKPTPADHSAYEYVIDPGSSLTSAVIGRMSVRATDPTKEVDGKLISDDQMPRVGTEHVDEQGVEIVSDWIDQLDLECPLVPKP